MYVIAITVHVKPEHVEAYLDLFDGRDLADAWTTSADVDQTKPEPDPLSVAAERSVEHWGESSWRAAVIEARATVALAEGDPAGHRRLSSEAAEAYAAKRQAVSAA